MLIILDMSADVLFGYDRHAPSSTLPLRIVSPVLSVVCKDEESMLVLFVDTRHR